MAGATAFRGKIPHIDKVPELPPYKIKKDSAFGGKSIWRRITFNDFKSPETKDGKRNAMMGIHKHHADYVPMVTAYDTKFVNSDPNTYAFIMDPNPEWADITDCGEFPCTAPYNVIFRFKNSSWVGDNQLGKDF
jgi:hypothetical protein